MSPAPPDPRRFPIPLLQLAAAILFVSPLLMLAPSLAAPLKKMQNPHGDLKEECSLCHSATGWTPVKTSSKFNHAKYGFALEGAHQSAACMSCHTSLDFKQKRTQCASCHEDVHRGEMGADCAKCHGARSFIDRSAMLRQHQLTRFPLTGAHAGLECESCHPGQPQGHMQFVGTEARCVSCHQKDYDATTVPNHKAGGYPLECQQCHSPTTWNSAKFNHDVTRFPLTGAHRAAACASCHGDGVFRGKATDCFSCHQNDYNGTNDPPHAASGYSTGCITCHTTANWNATFNHDVTRFPLTGAHRTAACASCHSDGVYRGKPTACASCHQGDYNSTSNPPHAASGFSTACATCHTTTTWSGATFDHDARFFPINSGRHAGRWSACSDCHTNSANYAVFTCLSCHPHSDKAQTDSNHNGRSGYRYDSAACYSCHPRGNT
jgi:Zn finger protein HypA/HybF involved in hydrogenase expression